AVAVEPPLAAFELAGRAGIRVLHQKDVAASLDRAGRRPHGSEPAYRPRPPQPWIGRTIKRDRRTAGGGGEMRDRGVGPDIDPRLCEQPGQLRPVEPAFEALHRRIAPDLVEITPLGLG